MSSVAALLGSMATAFPNFIAPTNMTRMRQVRYIRYHNTPAASLPLSLLSRYSSPGTPAAHSCNLNDMTQVLPAFTWVFPCPLHPPAIFTLSGRSAFIFLLARSILARAPQPGNLQSAICNKRGSFNQYALAGRVSRTSLA